MKQPLRRLRHGRVLAGGHDGRRDFLCDFERSDGPLSAAIFARGAHSRSTPHIVSPLSCSMPFVTPGECRCSRPNPFATSRSAFDGTAITTTSAPATARAKSDS